MGLTVKEATYITIILYFTALGAQLFFGTLDSVLHLKCDSMRRIEYIFPGYRIGYWLGEKA